MATKRRAESGGSSSGGSASLGAGGSRDRDPDTGSDPAVIHAYPRLALWRRLVIYLIDFLVGRYDRLDEDWNLRDHAPNEV